MSLSIKIQKQRVLKATKPVYEGLNRYYDQLQSLIELIETKDDIDAIELALAKLPVPTDFLAGSLRVKKNKKHPLPGRQKAREQLYLATAYLNTLHHRLDLDDINRKVKPSKKSALELHTRYLSDCVLAMKNCVDPRTLRSYGITAGRSMYTLTTHVATRANEFRILSAGAVESFNEKEYLKLNADVQAAVEKGSISSGIEHFARSGYRECLAGYRDSAGFKLKQVELASIPSFDTPKVEQSRDVILACGEFDELWYRLSCPQHLSHTQNALDHYVAVGEGLGCMPNEWFDPSWYRNHYELSDDIPNAFAHYLSIGRLVRLKPNAVMDPIYYAARYSQLMGSHTEGVKHYYTEGVKLGYQPSAEFNAKQYIEREMNGDTSLNPITHFRRSAGSGKIASYGDADSVTRSEESKVAPTLAMAESKAASAGNPYAATIVQNTTLAQRTVRKSVSLGKSAKSGSVSAVKKTSELSKAAAKRSWNQVRHGGTPAAAHTVETNSTNGAFGSPKVDVASQIKYFANAGPLFEDASRIDTSLIPPKARTIAFFLPQFYAFNQNDEWWGKGFTEWRNVSRGTPRFEGHYQPRIPRDLGFYDLTNEDTLRAQSELAKQAGIEAFCFYYYWFNGERLMDKPLDLFTEADIDQDFCIMWANENWTRTWDGFEGQVLIQQDYRDEDEDAFIEDTARYFNHPRYTMVNDRPLFILYRPGLLPDAEQTIARWKKKWERLCGVEPWVLMVQGFGDENPTEYDLDGAVEFPPHKLCASVPDMNSSLNIIDPNYSGNARSYNEVIDVSLSEEAPSFPLIKTVSPHWDNDARREGRGLTLHGSTPENYERWLRGATKFAQENPFHGEPLVFINAWNEWAEGAYLEPDVHYGHAYINATQRAVHGLIPDQKRQGILLVGHDGYQHGAQLLLRSVAEMCRKQFGMSVVIAIKKGGPMVHEYGELAKTVVLEGLGPNALTDLVKEHNIGAAICNTSVTGDLVPILKGQGVSVVSLIHELPNLITEYGLEDNLVDIARYADHVVFPATMVEEGFNQFAPGGNAIHHIRPQGSYKAMAFDAEARAEVREELGVADHEKLVLNVGFADLRKGFDMFMQVAKQMISERNDVHFVWLGNRAEDIDLWLTADLDESILERLHLVDFTDNVSGYYSASDAFYLSSREDPYPTVVLEAMAVGMPVVLHEETTGFDELANEYGYCIPKSQPGETANLLEQALFNDSVEDKQQRARYVAEECQFDDYCFDLLQMAQPDLKKISVVVPNYNYEQYMSSRLNSVFDQTYPVFETIVLDDCSSDGSVVRIEEVAKMANRHIRFSPNRTNSGNTFKQWKKGMSLVRGDLVWIAEADDWANPEFLKASVAKHTDNTALSFTDSNQIDTDNNLLAPSYSYYYDTVDASLFSRSFAMRGDAFVTRAMAVKNVIMNVSSVLWNRDDLEEGLEALGDDLTSYKLVGDWRLYLQALLTEGREVAYIHRALNTHRRHAESVTHALDHEKHLAEIQMMHQVVLENMSDNDPSRATLEGDIAEYVDELRVQFGLSSEDDSAGDSEVERVAA